MLCFRRPEAATGCQVKDAVLKAAFSALGRYRLTKRLIPARRYHTRVFRRIMTARIFLPGRVATQSGQANDRWTLEYEPASPRQIEPLMGWTSSTDMRSQIRLNFDSKEEAIAYAERNGIAYRVEVPKEATRKIISYSENFMPNRKVPWSH